MTFMCLIIISQIATFGVFQCNFHELCLQLLGYFFATNAHPRKKRKTKYMHIDLVPVSTSYIGVL